MADNESKADPLQSQEEASSTVTALQKVSDFPVLTPEEEAFVQEAAGYLEHPSFLMKLTDLVGKPLESATQLIPEVVHEGVNKALMKTFETALMTLPDSTTPQTSLEESGEQIFRSGLFHTMGTALTGAAGGLLGIPGFVAELPITTGLMFRSIAQIAQENGEDLSTLEARLECLTIFSHGGGHSPQQSAMESAYLTTRASFVALTREAAGFVAKYTGKRLTEVMAKGGAPILVRMMAQIASRFNLVVSQKFFAQAVPIAGAIGGGAINAAFTDHFNRVARYHFGLRRLEREYGEEAIRKLYEESALLLEPGLQEGD